jgi:hypothetical protein
MRTIGLLLCVLLGAAVVWAEDDLEIGTRQSGGKAPEPTPEQFQALLRKLTAPAPVKTAWEKSDAAQSLVSNAKAEPELFFRVMIPPKFPRAVANAGTEVRAHAAAVLGQTRDRRMLQALINSAVYDPECAVRDAAADALVRLEEPIALRKLVDIAISADYQKYPWPVRKSACQAIKRYGDKEAVERMLREFTYEVAAGSPLDSKNKIRGHIRGIGTDDPMALPSAPPDLHLSEQDLYPALSALKEVTGKSFNTGEKDVKTWAAWWKKESDKFEFKK